MIVLSSPELVVGGLAFTIWRGTVVPRDVAIAVYTGQVQLCAIFAALAPIAFIFYQYIRPSLPQIRRATHFVVLELYFSLLGIIYSFANLIALRFDLTSVVMPFLPVGFAATFLMFYLLGAMGVTRRPIEWVKKGRRGIQGAQNQGLS